MPKCTQCPDPAEQEQDLCVSCSIELTCKLMDQPPDPELRSCRICKAGIRYTEARVLRNAKNPKIGSTVTPFLCWVCARLHLSAIEEAKEPAVI